MTHRASRGFTAREEKGRGTSDGGSQRGQDRWTYGPLPPSISRERVALAPG